MPKMSMMMFTIQEVADKMKVSNKTIRRLIKRGDLVAYRVGDRGQLRVKADDLEQYLEKQRVQVTTRHEPSDAATSQREGEPNT